VGLYLNSLITPSWCGVQLKAHGNFTLPFTVTPALFENQIELDNILTNAHHTEY
jgi:hypothetical protein